MPKLIVVEGPDGSGKSTLLTKLAQDLGRVVIHSGGPPADRRAWVEKLARLQGLRGQPVLIDRAPQISEIIYSQLYNRPLMDLKKDLLNDLQEMEPVMVYCRLPSVFEMARSIDRSPKAHKSAAHMKLVLENYPRLVRDYDDLIDEVRSLIPVLDYSWVTDRYDYLVQELRECAV
jgi:thymidylate kinase